MSIENDDVEHPAHYTQHPSGVECIDIARHLNFCLGSAFKYTWRLDLKEDAIKDLKKAVKYIKFEIEDRLKERIKHKPYSPIKFEKIKQISNIITKGMSPNLKDATINILASGLMKCNTIFKLDLAIYFLQLEIKERESK